MPSNPAAVRKIIALMSQYTQESQTTPLQNRVGFCSPQKNAPGVKQNVNQAWVHEATYRSVPLHDPAVVDGFALGLGPDER